MHHLDPRLQCIINIAVVAVIASVQRTSLAAGFGQFPQIVNIDSTKYGDLRDGLPTFNLSEPAGTYLISPVDPQTDAQALYTAWDPFAPQVDWLNTLEISLASNGNQAAPVADLGDTTMHGTPQQAFSDPNNVPVTVTLPMPDTIEFGVDDNNLSDNQGGISFTIQAIPEPSSTFLAITAAATLSAFRPSRHRLLSH
jgi:hypothetical protein